MCGFYVATKSYHALEVKSIKLISNPSAEATMIGKLLSFIFSLIGFAVVVAFAVLEAYVWITYGLKPAGEVPVWAMYLMFKW